MRRLTGPDVQQDASIGEQATVLLCGLRISVTHTVITLCQCLAVVEGFAVVQLSCCH